MRHHLNYTNIIGIMLDKREKKHCLQGYSLCENDKINVLRNKYPMISQFSNDCDTILDYNGGSLGEF